MRRNNRSRGFTTVMAIALIPLITMAMMVMTWRVKHEAYSLREQRRATEIRQLLLAGGAAALKLVATPGEILELAVPEALKQRGGGIVVESLPVENGISRSVEVRVTLEGVKAQKNLTFGRAGAGWLLLSIE